MKDINKKIKLTESEMGNTHIISIKKQNSKEYCQYFHKNERTTDNITVSSTNQIHQIITIGEIRKIIIIISQETKLKNKRGSLSRKGSKRNFKSYNVNYEEQTIQIQIQIFHSTSASIQQLIL